MPEGIKEIIASKIYLMNFLYNIFDIKSVAPVQDTIDKGEVIDLLKAILKEEEGIKFSQRLLIEQNYNGIKSMLSTLHKIESINNAINNINKVGFLSR